MALQHKNCRVISVNLELHAHSWVRSKIQHKKITILLKNNTSFRKPPEFPNELKGSGSEKAKVQLRSLDCWKNSPNQEYDKRSAVWVLAHILCSWWDQRQAWTQLVVFTETVGRIYRELWDNLLWKEKCKHFLRKEAESNKTTRKVKWGFKAIVKKQKMQTGSHQHWVKTGVSKQTSLTAN